MNLIRRLAGLAGLLLCCLWAGAVQAAPTGIQAVRLWTAPDNTRLVFDLTDALDYHVFRLHDPERVVIDLKLAVLRANLNALPVPDPVVLAVRQGTPEGGSIRIVLDVKENVQPRTMLLKPMQDKPYRLVVDLMRPEAEAKEALRATDVRGNNGLVIAVDAGHGGEDPGAIGPRGVQEKDVTLAVAKRLAAIINDQPGMRAVLIRKGDYFVPLLQRVRLARQAKADMMISIHADSVRRHDVKGASVYMLSEQGATPNKAAAALAAKENAADQIGGVPQEQVDDPMVSQILGDMFRRDSLTSSQILAEEILKRLRAEFPIKYEDPMRARFVVLGALEIPSVLVEMDYISNPSREQLLRDGKHQNEIASALFDATRHFFQQMGRLAINQGKAKQVKSRQSETTDS